VATLKPRLNVVVEPEQHHLLLSLGKLQGRSAASYLRELVDGAQPYLQHLFELEQARALGTEAFADRVRSISASVLDTALSANQGNLFQHLGELSALASPGKDASPAPHSERKRARKRESGRNGAKNG